MVVNMQVLVDKYVTIHANFAIEIKGSRSGQAGDATAMQEIKEFKSVLSID